MKRVEFKFWPWGILSGATVAAAIVTCYVLVTARAQELFAQPRESWRIAAICFSILAAGNAYLLAIATGDFGRSLLAVPLCAVIGFLSVHVMRVPCVPAVYTILLLAFIAENALNYFIGEMLAPRVVLGCATICLLLMIVLGLMTSRASTRSALDQPAGLSLMLCYPLMMSIVTASMPVEWTFADMFGAVLTGTRAALLGLLAGVLAGFFPALLLSSLLRPNLPSVPGNLILDGFAASLLVANVVCIRVLFRARGAPSPRNRNWSEAMETASVAVRCAFARD